MAYRLEENESPAAGLKRIAEEQLAGAIHQLLPGQDLNQNIYQARKYLKRARSVLRLLASSLGPIYVEENRRLRDVGRRFSALRDACVSFELLETFAPHYKRKSALNPQRRLLSDQQSSLQAEDWQPVLLASVAVVTATCKRIESWPLHHLTMSSLEAEISKTHKQNRHRFERAQKTGAAKDFHEFRKSVKRELNQTRLIGPWDNRLKNLAALLGDHHNLAVLLEHVHNASKRFQQIMRRELRQREAVIKEVASQIYAAAKGSGLAAIAETGLSNDPPAARA